jgi:peptidoglycan/LPS O-acetylase OafA/YrhL
MSKTETSQSGRMIQLDFLRGVAIILVMFHHSAIHNVALGVLNPIINPLIVGGWTGVTLFFVLSGFLVGGLLFKEIKRAGKVDVGRFLIRRGFKIWPPYLAFVAYYFIKLLHRGDGFRNTFLALWPNLLHVQNYFPTPPHHTWSLAVEEHFYLSFAIFIAILMRAKSGVENRLKMIPWISGALLIICLGLRCANWNVPFTEYTHMWRTHECIDSLFLGVCLGYIYHFHPATFESWSKYRVSLIIFAIAAYCPLGYLQKAAHYSYTIGMTLLSLGCAGLLVAVVPPPSANGAPSGFWNSRAVRLLAWIGVYSYSIYLWHYDLIAQPLFSLMMPVWKTGLGNWQGPLYLALFFTGSILAGALLAKVIEFPALRLRDRLMPATGRKSGATKAAEGMPAGGAAGLST